MKLGFTSKEAEDVLSFYTSKKLNLSINNVLLWLQLLRCYHVEQAIQVVSKNPIILTSKAATAALNAEGVQQWLHGLRFTQDMTVALIERRPMLFNVPHVTAAAVETWLVSNLGWSSSMVIKVLIRHPHIFGCSVSNLNDKLAWFQSQGLSIQAISKVLMITPGLFSRSTAYNISQLSELRGLGLSEHQVNEMVRRRPHLLVRGISTIVTKAKIRFLTLVMGQCFQNVLVCPAFLTYSLFDRIGPRWAFHLRYCKDKPFVLNSRLNPTDKKFADGFVSSSLDSASASRGMTRMQLYEEVRVEWKQGPGKEWE